MLLHYMQATLMRRKNRKKMKSRKNPKKMKRKKNLKRNTNLKNQKRNWSRMQNPPPSHPLKSSLHHQQSCLVQSDASS
jgi:hypothetical protein